jgi:hypothetical protein
MARAKKEKPAAANMAMDLVIGKKDGSIDNASIPVRWCLTKPLLDAINESDYINPQVLIQVEYLSNYVKGAEPYVAHTDRHLFSLDQFIAYIPLSRAGAVNVSAFLVGITEGETKCYARALLDRRDSYDYRLDNLDTRLYVSGWSRSLDRDVQIDFIAKALDYKLQIPAEVFGKKPPAWIMNLINRYGNGKLVDQCALRRQMMLFPLKAPFILVEAVLRFTSMVIWYLMLAFAGFKDIPASMMVHPLTYWAGDFGRREMTYYTTNAEYSSMGFGKLWVNGLWLIHRIPVLLVSVIGVWVYGAFAALPAIVLTQTQFVFMVVLAPTLTYLAASLCAGLALAITLGVIALHKLVGHVKLVAGIVKVIAAPFIFIEKCYYGTVQLLEQHEVRKRKLALARSERYLTCNNNPHGVTADVSAIPLADQSVKLMYNNFKNKVCKPLAR